MGWNNANGQDKIYLFNSEGGYTEINGIYTGISGSIDSARVDISRIKFGDFNGDGITDVYLVQGWDNANGQDKIYLFDSEGGYTEINGVYTGIGGSIDSASVDISRIKFGDFNGDGITDVYLVSGWNNVNGQDKIYLFNSSGGYSEVNGIYTGVGGTIAAAALDISRINFGDFNGDGKTDIYVIAGWNGAATDKIYQSKGDGTYHSVDGIYHGMSGSIAGANLDVSRFKFDDFNGDGKTDIYLVAGWNNTATDTIYFSKGDGTYLTGSGVNHGMSGTIESASLDVSRFIFGDFDGNGKIDCYLVLGWGGQAVDQLSLNLSDSLNIFSIRSLGGEPIQVAYSSLADSQVYTKGSESNYPEINVQGTLNVVESAIFPDGAGGTRYTNYKYEGLRAHLQGQGLLGFEKVSISDSQTGISSQTTYSQTFPTIGFALDSETQLANGDLLSNSSIGYQSKQINNNGVITHFPYVSQSTEQSYVLNSATGRTEWVSTATTNSTYDNYGNPLSITVSTTDNASSWSTQTLNTYTNNEANWHLGRLTRTAVTSQAPNTPSITRTSGFEYDPATGHLIKEIIEPDNHSLSLTTTYTHDEFGNRVTATRCGGDPALCEQGAAGSRTATTIYDSNGQFPVTTTNALGHAETKVYDPRFGVVTGHTGPNGIATTWQYDSLGRQILETRADGNQTTVDRAWCDASCPADAYYKVTAQTDGSSPGVVYFDQFDREIRKEAVGFNDSPIYVDTEYDNFGRVKRSSNPYSPGETIYWSTPTYDVLGRVISQQSTDGSVSTISYSQFSVTATNALGQHKTETRNAIGQLINVTDEIGGSVVYSYSADGNLLSTQSRDSLLSKIITSTIDYNALGRKIKMIDPDKGTWFYTYNTLGELIKQYKVVSTHNYSYSLDNALADSTVKMQRVEITYDVLGRMKTRKDYRDNNTLENTSTWTYDTATYGIGKLKSVSANGKTTNFSYDQYGRIIGQSDIIGSTLGVYTTTYDGYGRVSEVTDAVSSGSGTVNHYKANGHLESVTDLSTGDLLYQINVMNSRGQVTEVLMGNGHTTQRVYDDPTGQLLQIYAGNGITVLQDITYDWDEIGNMLSRHDQSAPSGTVYNQQQSFCYDALNRLIKTYDGTLNGSCGGLPASSQDVRYADFGNITFKANVGAYSYGTISFQPHAVKSTSLNGTAVTYNYDKTGNLLSDSTGRSFKYTTYDLPYEMIKGSVKVQFWYGADRSRYKRVDTNTSTGEANTTYYLGNVEKVVKADGSYEMKRYIGDYALWTHQFDASGNETGVDKQYFYKDVLGSTNLITDGVGTPLSAMAFNPWGERVQATSWVSNIQPFLTAWNIDQLFKTSRGFTGHEHVDALGVIHMNGRIYDPKLGRFIQADPQVDGVTDTQGFNRYAYVRNNPLNKVDPSGYGWASKQWKRHKDRRRKANDLRRESHKLSAGYQSYKKTTNEALRFHFRRHDVHVNNVRILGKIDDYLATHRWAQAAVTIVATIFGNAYGAAGATMHIAYAQGAGVNDVREAGQRAYAIAAVSQYINTYIDVNVTNPALNVVARGVAGGTISAANGGKFESAFWWAGGSQALAQTYKAMLQQGINLGEADAEVQGVYPDEIPFATQSAGPKVGSISDFYTAQFGFKFDGIATFGDELSLQWIPKNIPFMHPISIHHDMWNGVLMQKFGDGVFAYSNYPTMVGSAVISVGGSVRNYTWVESFDYKRKRY